MAHARIYRPSRTAMQSGKAKTKEWLLEFEPLRARRPDPLMGWSGGGDTLGQVRLEFPTREDAEAYAQRHGIDYTIEAPRPRRLVLRTYADNFRYDRVE